MITERRLWRCRFNQERVITTEILPPVAMKMLRENSGMGIILKMGMFRECSGGDEGESAYEDRVDMRMVVGMVIVMITCPFHLQYSQLSPQPQSHFRER